MGRPALFNQADLIELRTKNQVHHIYPGLTEWAQINGRNELPIPVKVQFDIDYCQNRSFGVGCHNHLFDVFKSHKKRECIALIKISESRDD